MARVVQNLTQIQWGGGDSAHVRGDTAFVIVRPFKAENDVGWEDSLGPKLLQAPLKVGL